MTKNYPLCHKTTQGVFSFKGLKMGKLTKSTKVKDIKEVIKIVVNLVGEVTQEIKDAVDGVAQEVAEDIYTLSQQYVPVSDEIDAGRLRDSGSVEKSGEGYEISYGKGMTDDEGGKSYAFFVHEDMPRGVEKKYTTPGTGPHYLSRAVFEVVGNDNELLKIRIQKALQKELK